MEKLELKHLAPYLPYGLRGEVRKPHYLKEENPIGELIKVEKTEDGVMVKICSDINNEVFIRAGEFAGEDGWVYNFKPILRPLSDLKKDEFSFIYENETDYESLRDWLNLDFESKLTLKYSYLFWAELFRYYFDVFGLIEKGLAIDINTLESTTNKSITTK
jgi:hypothetical protein